jgi:TPR repeat protein
MLSKIDTQSKTIEPGVRRGAALWVVLILLCVTPIWADTQAGLDAFKNKDYAKAFREWKTSADAGLADAQFDLGVLYAHGLGVPQDLGEAERWYRRSAEQGYPDAEFALGEMYARGWSAGARDQANAMRWLQLQTSGDTSMPTGDWDNMTNYGLAKDEKQAANWYRLAAEKGLAEAQYSLGRLYATGKGVPHDEEQATMWVRAAASQGFPAAEARLGARYAAGLGTPQDDHLAYFWLTLAFLQGEKSVEKLRTAEAAKLKPADVSATDLQAQRWKPRTIVKSAKP